MPDDAFRFSLGSSRVKHLVFGVALLAVSASVLAQSAAVAGRPDPGDASAPVPPAVHQSPFAHYRPFAAEVLGPWREANDEVGRIGGWKAYAREAHEGTRQPAPVTSGPGDPAATTTNPGAAKAK